MVLLVWIGVSLAAQIRVVEHCALRLVVEARRGVFLSPPPPVRGVEPYFVTCDGSAESSADVIYLLDLDLRGDATGTQAVGQVRRLKVAVRAAGVELHLERVAPVF